MVPFLYFSFTCIPCEMLLFLNHFLIVHTVHILSLANHSKQTSCGWMDFYKKTTCTI